MVYISINKNKAFNWIMLIFIIISIFSIYCMSDYSRPAEMRMVKDDEIQFCALSEHAMSTVDNLEKNVSACIHVLQENTDNFNYKLYLGSLLGVFSSCWLYFQLILLAIYYVIFYIRDWLIKVVQNRYDLFLVHFIQLKDGKKNALEVAYSF